MSTTEKKKSPYRALTIPERDTLYAFYEKHNGNMLAMTRDHECLFKAYNAIRYYADLYGFQPKLIENRQKRAQEVIAQLGDSKILAIKRAVELVEPRMIPLKHPVTGAVILDREGQPVFIEKQPSFKEIEAAWRIIKTELGEATVVSKTDLTSKGEKLSVPNAIQFVDFSGDAAGKS